MMSEKLIPNGFCVLPWVSQFRDNDGVTAPCCLYRAQEAGALKLSDLKQAMLKGEWSPGCKDCQSFESRGGSSYRLQRNQQYPLECQQILDGKAQGLIDLDLRVGNLCNLRCKMCGPSSTRKWVQNWNELHPKEYGFSENALKGFLVNPWSRDPSQWDDLWQRSQNLKTLNFAGGEPFLSPEVEVFLQRFIDSGQAAQISLHFITNLTVLPESLLTKFSSFQQTSLTVSLDGAWELNDYIRSLSDFEVIAKHLHVLDQRFHELKLDRISVNTTFQAYNVLGIQALVDFLKQFKNILPLPYLNPLTDPDYFSAKVLPSDLRSLGAERLEKIATESVHAPEWLRSSFQQSIQFLREESPAHERLLGVLLKETLKLEKASGPSLKQVAPELYMALYLS